MNGIILSGFSEYLLDSYKKYPTEPDLYNHIKEENPEYYKIDKEKITKLWKESFDEDFENQKEEWDKFFNSLNNEEYY